MAFTIGVSVTLLSLLGVGTWKAPRLMSTLIWSLLATLAMSSLLIKLLPGQLRENFLLVVYMVPLFWVGIQIWCYWAENKWRVFWGLAAATVLCSIISFTI